MTVAVVGATGYTGRLVCAELVRRGTPFVAVARNPEKLERVEGASDRRVADTSDPEALRTALEGTRAALSCVGPFVDLGEPVLGACIDAGVHYADTTGEQAFMRTVFDDYGARARDAGVALVPAIGFDYVPGDMGAALAAKELGTAPERIRVSYLVRGMKSSDGTKRTGMRVAELPCLAYRDGELTETSIGSVEREVDFDGRPTNVALWPGGEALTVPRHTGARNVEVYMRMPKAMARMARGHQKASPLFRAGKRAVGTGTRGPSDEDRKKGHYTVVAEAEGGGRTVRCTVTGTEMYGMTAAASAEALARMSADGFDAKGALAPSEAFDPEGFLGALSDYLSWDTAG